MRCRLATVSDYAAIRSIYAQYMDTPITFEYTLPSEENYAARLAAIQKVNPCLVSEEAGQITGFCYAHCPWERKAYQWNSELSIYLDRTVRGRGTGTRLYAAILALLRLQNVRVALGCITVPNEPSIALHSRFGFRESARFERAGWKNGAWHDVVWLSLDLVQGAELTTAPAALVPVDELPAQAVADILARHSS